MPRNCLFEDRGLYEFKSVTTDNILQPMFENMSSIQAHRPGTPMLLLLDLNCHSEDRQPVLDKPTDAERDPSLLRKSDYIHVPTAREESTLADILDAGLIILNGMTRFSGTRACTHHPLVSKKTGQVSASLLDYGLCSEQMLPNITYMKLHYLKKVSDHKAVEVRYRQNTNAISTGSSSSEVADAKHQSSNKHYVLGKAGLDRFTLDLTEYLNTFPAITSSTSMSQVLRQLHTKLIR